MARGAACAASAPGACTPYSDALGRLRGRAASLRAARPALPCTHSLEHPCGHKKPVDIPRGSGIIACCRLQQGCGCCAITTGWHAMQTRLVRIASPHWLEHQHRPGTPGHGPGWRLGGRQRQSVRGLAATSSALLALGALALMAPCRPAHGGLASACPPRPSCPSQQRNSACLTCCTPLTGPGAATHKAPSVRPYTPECHT